MFEKIKEKASKGKQWIINNKTELAYVGGCFVGAVVTMAVYTHDDNKKMAKSREKYSDELKVIGMRDYANCGYAGHGKTGPTIGNLSNELINLGMPENATVVGALVYAKK